MEFSAEMIASFLGGEILGDKTAKVTSVSKIEEGKPGSLSFLSNPKYEEYIYTTEASVVIVNKTFQPREAVKATLIRVEDAYASLAQLLYLYVANKPQKEGISPLCSIAEDAQVAEDAYVGEFAVIDRRAKVGKNCKIYPHVYVGEGAVIGDHVTLHPGVTIYEGCVLKDHVNVHAGSVIGADGFGFAPTADGSFKKIPQIGNVILESGVDIGANTCIDRATMGSTVIKKGVKLDNLIQVGHNVVIGENTVSAAQMGVAGSTKIGANCMFGGQVGIAGHIQIPDRTQVGSQSGISGTIRQAGSVVLGSPAFDAARSRRASIAFRDLPEMHSKIKAMEKELAELKARLEEKA